MSGDNADLGSTPICDTHPAPEKLNHVTESPWQLLHKEFDPAEYPRYLRTTDARFCTLFDAWGNFLDDAGLSRETVRTSSYPFNDPDMVSQILYSNFLYSSICERVDRPARVAMVFSAVTDDLNPYTAPRQSTQHFKAYREFIEAVELLKTLSMLNRYYFGVVMARNVARWTFYIMRAMGCFGRTYTMNVGLTKRSVPETRFRVPFAGPAIHGGLQSLLAKSGKIGKTAKEAFDNAGVIANTIHDACGLFDNFRSHDPGRLVGHGAVCAYHVNISYAPWRNADVSAEERQQRSFSYFHDLLVRLSDTWANLLKLHPVELFLYFRTLLQPYGGYYCVGCQAPIAVRKVPVVMRCHALGPRPPVDVILRMPSSRELLQCLPCEGCLGIPVGLFCPFCYIGHNKKNPRFLEVRCTDANPLTVGTELGFLTCQYPEIRPVTCPLFGSANVFKNELELQQDAFLLHHRRLYVVADADYMERLRAWERLNDVRKLMSEIFYIRLRRDTIIGSATNEAEMQMEEVKQKLKALGVDLAVRLRFASNATSFGDNWVDRPFHMNGDRLELKKELEALPYMLSVDSYKRLKAEVLDDVEKLLVAPNPDWKGRWKKLPEVREEDCVVVEELHDIGLV